MKTLLVPVTLLVAGFATAPAAWACYTVHFNNKTDSTVEVLWTALGCFKISAGVNEVCTHHTIGAGHSNSYDYKWLTTIPVLHVRYDGSDVGEKDPYFASKYHKVYYQLKSGGKEFEKVSWPNTAHVSPNGCHEHYTITYTEQELKTDWHSYTAQENRFR
jgi:hypothetical protein